jgi:hypothetical protein
MRPVPDVQVETIADPARYTFAQIAEACVIAQLLNRGRLVLAEAPRRRCG